MSMRSILDREPWHYSKRLLVFRRLRTGDRPSSLSFKIVNWWVHVKDAPFHWNSEPIARGIGEMLGEVIGWKVDDGTFRVRVGIDVTKPLRRGIWVEEGRNRSWFYLAYEKLPNFCYRCGLLEHTLSDCKLKEKENEVLQYGDWLRARGKATNSIPSQPPSQETSFDSTGRSPSKDRLNRALFLRAKDLEAVSHPIIPLVDRMGEKITTEHFPLSVKQKEEARAVREEGLESSRETEVTGPLLFAVGKRGSETGMLRDLGVTGKKKRTARLSKQGTPKPKTTSLVPSPSPGKRRAETDVAEEGRVSKTAKSIVFNEEAGRSEDSPRKEE